MTSLLHLRRIVPAALLAATAALGGSAIVDPATACAAPAEWDIGAYDRCVAKANDAWAEGLIKDLGGALRECCEKTGGVYILSNQKCQAPPANSADAPQQPILPGVAPRPGVVTEIPAPPPPPIRNPEVTMPFQPGPVSPG
jgi:hypothetical protein